MGKFMEHVYTYTSIVCGRARTQTQEPGIQPYLPGEDKDPFGAQRKVHRRKDSNSGSFTNYRSNP